VRPEDAAPRLAALGFRDEDVATLAAHFLDAEAHGDVGHGLARIAWLETWDELDPEARPQRVVAEPEYERWDGAGALGYVTLAAVVAAQLSATCPFTPRRLLAHVSNRDARLLGTAARRRWPRRAADRHLAPAAAASHGRGAVDGDESPGNCDPVE